jgi:hypothetical protein
MKQVSKQSTIMKHCVSEFFCTHWLPAVSDRYIVSDSIVLYHDWMIHGDISNSLLKITDWISTSSHYLRDQTVSSLHRLSWLVNEMSLFSFPLICESTPLLFIERHDLQSGNAFLSLVQNLFGGAGAAL